jgi:hypothetical protein
MLRRARIVALLLALPLLVTSAPSSSAAVAQPTTKPSKGTAIAYYSEGGGGSTSAYANLFLTGTISFGKESVESFAWVGLGLVGDTPFLLYSPVDLAYREIGTCQEVDTVFLDLQAPATATLDCTGRLGDSGPMSRTVFQVVLPTATPQFQYHYNMRYDGVYAS